MAIIGGDKKSLIGADTFKWEDQDKRDNIMCRMYRNIKFDDNIVVREDEIAVFYRDGKALAYIDRPDRYALTDINAPIVGKLVKFLSGVQQQAEVVLPPEACIRRQVRFQAALPVPGQGVRDGQPTGLRGVPVQGLQPENFVNQFVGTLNFATSRRGRGAHQGTDGDPHLRRHRRR